MTCPCCLSPHSPGGPLGSLCRLPLPCPTVPQGATTLYPLYPTVRPLEPILYARSALLAILQICLSLPLMAFVVDICLRQRPISIFAACSIFVVTGVSSDNMFVVHETWQQARNLCVDGVPASRASRVRWSEPRATFALLPSCPLFSTFALLPSTSALRLRPLPAPSACALRLHPPPAPSACALRLPCTSATNPLLLLYQKCASPLAVHLLSPWQDPCAIRTSSLCG